MTTATRSRVVVGAKVAPDLADDFALAARASRLTVSEALRRAMEAFIAVAANNTGAPPPLSKSAPADPKPLREVASGQPPS